MRKWKELLYPWAQRLRRAPLLFWFCWYRFIKKTNVKQVLFFSSERASLTGNLRFLFDAAKEGREELCLKVILKEGIQNERQLGAAFAQSAFVLVDEFEPRVYVLPFGKDQKLIQVWHAMGAFKKVGFARENAVKTSLSHRNYTDVIVSAEGVRGCYARSFGVAEERVHALGIPRTDAFFDEGYRLEKKRELLEQYPILRDKKLILFAPTFRGENRDEGAYPTEFLDIAALCEALGEEYVLGVKLHPLIKNKLDVPPGCEGFVLDLTAHREVNDLLFSASVLVTDYSSVIFENALLGTPVVFYVPDYAAYAQGRGFYFPFETYLYGAKAQNTQELVAAVRAGRVDAQKLKEFRARFIENCDGHASERIVKELLV